MNKERRRALNEQIDILEGVISEIEFIRGDEESSFDSLPESFQDGERGDQMQDCMTSIEDAEDNLNDAIENARNAIDEGNNDKIKICLDFVIQSVKDSIDNLNEAIDR